MITITFHQCSVKTLSLMQMKHIWFGSVGDGRRDASVICKHKRSVCSKLSLRCGMMSFCFSSCQHRC